MYWNWEKPDWPDFSWNAGRLAASEEKFLLETGKYIGVAKHLKPGEHEELTVQAMSSEALKTSEIEGEILDRVSVQSSIQRQLGLKTDRKKSKPAEDGIAKVMVNLYKRFAAPLDEELLFSWHKMLFQSETGMKNIGCYRTSKEPMQVVSGALYLPKVHFEAPPSFIVPKEMRSLIRWFNRSGPGGKKPLPALTRAGIAHLYFVSVHPFEDGNGRIARALAEKALSQNLGQPTLIALAATILARRKAYYEILEAANKQNEITAWLCWFADAAIEAQRRTIQQVEFLIYKTRLLDRVRGQVNERQEKVVLRILKEGPEGFKGGLSAGNYATISGASPATTTRDLTDLMDKGVLSRTGEKRHTRYYLTSTPG